MGFADNAPVVINKEMGITHAEFMRLLPIALRHNNYHVKGSIITIAETSRQLTIQLSPETERVIASIRLPVTHVKMKFTNFTKLDFDAFLTQFDNTYRRGGG